MATDDPTFDRPTPGMDTVAALFQAWQRLNQPSDPVSQLSSRLTQRLPSTPVFPLRPDRPPTTSVQDVARFLLPQTSLDTLFAMTPIPGGVKGAKGAKVVKEGMESAAEAAGRVTAQKLVAPQVHRKLFRETDLDELLTFIDPNMHASLPFGGGIFTSTTRDLATPQGRTKGVLLEFNPEGLETRQMFHKPGLVAAKEIGADAEEFQVLFRTSPRELAGNLERITIDKRVKNLGSGGYVSRFKRLKDDPEFRKFYDVVETKDSIVLTRKK